LSKGRIAINNRPDDLSQWTSFWQQGFITTFGASKANNYDGVIREFWREKFIDLADGSQILDVATGNGAIATLAAEVNTERSKNFFIAATDLAVVNTQINGDDTANALRGNVEFHSHIPCENQPFDDVHFDLVTSQFGFEYSDVKKSLSEIHRILKPSGRFIAISHHADSDLIKAAIIEIGVYQHAMDELDLFGELRSYAKAMGELSGAQNTVAGRIRKVSPLAADLMTKIKGFREQYPDEELCREIVDAISHLAMPRHASSAARIAVVDAAETDFGFARARLQDMARAAISQEGIELFSVMARDAGFGSVHCLKLYGGDQGLAGWQIHLGPA
jgi:ubiquinone/menaquinone biosynthesis C-methylase UbiE